MKTSRYLLLLILAGIVLSSCTDNKSKTPENPADVVEINEQGTEGSEVPAGKIIVADNIIYDVEIINPDPNDAWTTECLEGLDREALVDFIFQGIYSGKFSASHIFEDKTISPGKIKKMEKNGEFTRDQIGKFQFQEKWVLDTLNMTYTKMVTEIRMGIPNINENGIVTSYAPLMKVMLPL